MDERVGHLNQKRFQVRACTGNASGLNLCAALVIPWGKQPAQEHRFLAVGNTDMSPPISERTAIAVIGSLPRPGTVRRSWRISAKGSQMRRISCSRRWRSRRSWSIWSRHWRSFTACSGETAPVYSGLNLRKRGFAAPVHELCDVERFAGMCKDVFGNGTSGFAKDISEHIIQFEVGYGEAILSTVLLAGQHIRQLAAVTNEVAQMANGWRPG